MESTRVLTTELWQLRLDQGYQWRSSFNPIEQNDSCMDLWRNYYPTIIHQGIKMSRWGNSKHTLIQEPSTNAVWISLSYEYLNICVGATSTPCLSSERKGNKKPYYQIKMNIALFAGCIAIRMRVSQSYTEILLPLKNGNSIDIRQTRVVWTFRGTCRFWLWQNSTVFRPSLNTVSQNPPTSQGLILIVVIS